MIKILNTRLLTWICFIMSLAVLAACEKEDAKSDTVELLSFGPTGALHGDTLFIIGNNLDKVTAVELTGATVAKADFKKQTGEEIQFIVPESTEPGFIALVTPAGNITSITQLNLEVMPEITSVTTEARPGSNITISGNFMNWVTGVTFSNNKFVDSADFVSQSINELIVTVPMDAQTGNLVLSYGGTEPLEIETENAFTVTLPVVTALAPNPIKHQNNLTITGTNLDLVTEIHFTGVADAVTEFVSQSATQLVVKVPGATKNGTITLIAPSGVASESTLELSMVMPAVTSLAPNPIDHEANLTITGTNLDLVTGVSFTGITAPITNFVSKTATQLVVKVPAGTLKGKVNLSVLNSILIVESPQVLELKGGLPPLADLGLPIYTDALQNTFQNWSYTKTHKFDSEANVRQGSKSIRAEYDAGNGYQGITFHAGTPVSTTGFTKLEFSVFGEAGTGGKKLNVVMNGNYGGPAQVTLVEGEWTTFSLNLSAVGSPATIGEIVLQSAGWGGVIHIDHVGLR